MLIDPLISYHFIVCVEQMKSIDWKKLQRSYLPYM